MSGPAKPVFGERQIIRVKGGWGDKYYIILQEYRPRWFGLRGDWVTLESDYGYSSVKGSLERIESRLRETATADFSGEDKVLWRSTEGLGP